ncbi:MAG: glycosyltransferase [Gammaproteobacteria bacterium]|nr:glycosyltransferase [Gammaproteobacteria bacterium]
MSEFSSKLQGLSIYWVSSDRFDTKPDKSTWTEIGDSLSLQGARVSIVACYAKEPYFPEGKAVDMVYLKTLDLPLIYRISFTLSAFFWLLRNAARDDLIILNPHELWMLPLLKLARFRRLHLDVRTLPIAGRSMKDGIDIFLFWKTVMSLFGKSFSSYSFITQRLLETVEKEFKVRYEDHVIWQSGVNVDFFVEASKQVQPPASGKPFTVFYHGSLYKRRGVDRVVEAFAQLPARVLENSRLVIVGSGSGLELLRQQITGLGLESKVELRGFVPYEEIPQQIAGADVCICPLPDYPEWNVSSPLKVLEYMACGKPLILTPIPAHQDVLDGEAFVVWAKGDKAGDFVPAIVEAYDRQVELQEAALAAPALVRQDWDWSAHGAKFGDYLARHYIGDLPGNAR